MTRAWRENLVGQRFGRLLVTGEADPSSHRRWACRCDCGSMTTVLHPMLKKGATKSCGCLRREITAANRTRHGQARRSGNSRLYRTWAAMIARCTIPSATGFLHYGGAGVMVCDRWRTFENFAEDMGDPPAGKSIDRFPVSNGNYEPGNCRWATRQEQNENRKSVRWIEFDGKRMNVTQWARHLGLNKATLYEALEKHPIEVALRPRS